MFNKLRFRLAAVCAVSTGLVLIAMAAASYQFAAILMDKQWDKAFQNELNEVFLYLRGQKVIDHTYLTQLEVSRDYLIRLESKGRELSFTKLDVNRYDLTLAAGELARLNFGIDFRKPPLANGKANVAFFNFSGNDKDYRAASASVQMDAGNWLGIVVLKDKTPEKLQLARLRSIYICCVGVALIFIIMFAVIFCNWTIKPVKDGYVRQVEFISAASHEIRSPLAVMLACAGAIKDAPQDKATHFAGKIESECARLAGLTDDLLRLAVAESGRLIINRVPTDLIELAQCAAERYIPLANKKQIKLRIAEPKEAIPKIKCDSFRIDQILGILLDNAICYTPYGGEIQLTLDREGRYAAFYIADSGSGVAQEDREKIFEKFYRVDAARTNKEHYGLGLSIAREIAGLHKGKLFVRGAASGGAEFVLMLPI